MDHDWPPVSGEHERNQDRSAATSPRASLLHAKIAGPQSPSRLVHTAVAAKLWDAAVQKAIFPQSACGGIRRRTRGLCGVRWRYLKRVRNGARVSTLITSFKFPNKKKR